MTIVVSLVIIGLVLVGALLLVVRRRGGAGVPGELERNAQLRGQSDGWSDFNAFRQKSGPQ